MKKRIDQLFKPIDPSAISLFRICFALTLLYHLFEQFFFIADKFLKPRFFFSYPSFEFIKLWPDVGIYIHWDIMVVAAIFILLGKYYRCSIIIFWLAYSYFFLLDTTNYKNHFYLITLISFLMIFINADARYALSNSKDKLQYNWNVWILRFQFCVVYFFAGIAKINTDWFHGEPLSGLLNQSLKPFLSFYIYGGLFFDVLIPFLLINKRTRNSAIVIAAVFHAVNFMSFPNIRVFVLLMLSSLVLFPEPNWPKKFFKDHLDSISQPQLRFKKITVLLLSLYVLIQILLPLRHFCYPGNIMWTAQGERFSWRMVLKRMAGKATFKVVDNDTKDYWYIDPQKELNRRQYLQLVTTPEMILQYAHHLKDTANKKGMKDVSVYVNAQSTINGRPTRQMISPHLDLLRFSLKDDFTWWVVGFDGHL